MPYVVYVLACTDGSLYTGITSDLHQRLAAHRAGTGAKYTRSHPPERIVYTQKMRSKAAALRREHAIKQLPRKQKLELIRG